MNLDIPKLLINFILENLAEKSHFIIILLILLDAADDSLSPLNDELFESISLIEIGVHVLFHGFPCKLVLQVLFVVLLLLYVNIIYQLLELLQCKRSSLKGSLRSYWLR